MKKFVIALCAFFLFLAPLRAIADEPTTSIEQVTEFEQFYVELLQNGKFYTGVLLSIPEYTRFVTLEKDTLLLEKELKIFKDVNSKYDSLLSKWTIMADDVKNDLKAVKKELNKPVSFWDEWKGELGFIAGVAITVLVVYAVQQ